LAFPAKIFTLYASGIQPNALATRCAPITATLAHGDSSMLRINLQRLAKLTVMAVGAASLTGCIVLPRGPFGYHHGGHGGYHGGGRVIVPVPIPVPRYDYRHPRHHDHHDHHNHRRNGYPSAGQHEG
jgi:hypothetical protein